MNQIKDFINKNPKLTAFYLIWECFHLLAFTIGGGGDGFSFVLVPDISPINTAFFANYGWEELLFYSIVPILVYFVVVLLKKK